MSKRKPPSKPANNICFTGKGSGKQMQVQMAQIKKAMQHSISLTIVSAITFLLSLAIVTGVIGAAGKLAVVGTAVLLVASIAAALEARALFRAITEEHRVDKLKTEFISLASHQMRTPLSSMQWYAELLNEEKRLSKNQREYAKEILFAVRRMTNLIDSLLHAARLECEEIVPRKQKVSVNALMKDLSKEFKTSAKEKDIKVSMHVPNKPITITSDSTLLKVVFQNVFSNAVKYTKSKGTVDVDLRTQDNSVVVTVSDNGIGIPKKDQKRIFQRLFRASNVLKMDTDGNGLGLYITKMVLDSLGGKITVESTEGKGSTFTMKLPMKKKVVRKKKK